MNTANSSGILEVQARIPQHRVDPNDKVSKVVFDLGDKEIEARCVAVIEKNTLNLRITTHVSFISDVLEKFEGFDREVAFACMSLYENGNRYTTTEQIYRTMTGNLSARLPKTAERKIQLSLEKLISSPIRINLAGLKTMRYRINDPELFGTIVPAQFVTNISINGSNKTVIKFLGESPLMTLAKIKNNQLISYPVVLLDIGGGNSSERIIIRNYVWRRIQEVNLHRQMSHTITFDDVLSKNGLSDKRREEKKRYRDYLIRCFQAWKLKRIIREYNVVFKGKKVHGITFSFYPRNLGRV